MDWHACVVHGNPSREAQRRQSQPFVAPLLCLLRRYCHSAMVPSRNIGFLPGQEIVIEGLVATYWSDAFPEQLVSRLHTSKRSMPSMGYSIMYWQSWWAMIHGMSGIHWHKCIAKKYHILIRILLLNGLKGWKTLPNATERHGRPLHLFYSDRWFEILIIVLVFALLVIVVVVVDQDRGQTVVVEPQVYCHIHRISNHGISMRTIS